MCSAPLHQDSWYRARIRIHASIDQVRTQLPLAVSVSPDGPAAASSRSPIYTNLRSTSGCFEADFDILDPPDLAEAFIQPAERRTSERPRLWASSTCPGFASPVTPEAPY